GGDPVPRGRDARGSTTAALRRRRLTSSPRDDEGRSPPWWEPPFGRSCRSALAVLRRLAGLLETGLLALRDAGVPGEVTGLLQGRAVQLGVDPVERTRDTETDGTGLAGGATAVDAHEHVVGAVELERDERLVDDLLVDLVREVLLERAAVDLPLAGARDDPDAGDGLLAAAGAGAGSGGGGAGDGLGGADRTLGLGGVGAQLGLVALEDLGVDVFGGVS